jgi:hypothetical protein
MFCMDVRYEGGRRADGNFEPDLQLTDDVAKIEVRDVSSTGGEAFMRDSSGTTGSVYGQ